MKKKEILHQKGKPKKSTNIPKSKGQYISEIFIFIFAFILYGNTISHDYALDDDIITRKNSFVQEGIKGIPAIFSKGFLYGFNRANDQSYRPVVLANMALEKSMFGNNPHVHHFFNVFFYALTGVFLFLLLKRMLRSYPAYIPLLIVLLFLAHPIHTEVVANIKSRDEILGLLLGIACLIYLFKFVDSQNKKHLIISISLYFVTLLTKENFITFVLIIPIILYFFTEMKLKKITFISISFAGIFLIYMILRASILDSVTFNEKMDIINNGLMAAKNSSDQLATNFYILGKYIYLLFYPHPLSYDYSFNQIKIISWSDIKAFGSLIIYIVLAIIAVIGLKKKNIFSFGIIFFIVSMSVVSNLFIKIGSTLGERFLYTPSFAFCIMLILLISHILKLLKSKNTKYIYYLTGIILIFYSIKTISRNAAWENNFTLFSTDILTVPNSARANQSLAFEYMQLGQAEPSPDKKNELLNKAIEYYSKSILIYPKYSEAYYNKGVAFLQLNNNDSAKNCFLQSIYFEAKNAKSYNNLGLIFFNQKNADSATYYFSKAFMLDSNTAEICGNYALILHNKNKFKEAEYLYLKSLQLNPAQINIYSNLAILYQQTGNQEKATYYQRLLKEQQQVPSNPQH